MLVAYGIRMKTDRDSRESENAIFERYAAKLEAIAMLDRMYHAAPSPSLVERAEYHQRQDVLERMRLWLYAELDRIRQCSGSLPSNLPS